MGCACVHVRRERVARAALCQKDMMGHPCFATPISDMRNGVSHYEHAHAAPMRSCAAGPACATATG